MAGGLNAAVRGGSRDAAGSCRRKQGTSQPWRGCGRVVRIWTTGGVAPSGARGPQAACGGPARRAGVRVHTPPAGGVQRGAAQRHEAATRAAARAQQGRAYPVRTRSPRLVPARSAGCGCAQAGCELQKEVREASPACVRALPGAPQRQGPRPPHDGPSARARAGRRTSLLLRGPLRRAATAHLNAIERLLRPRNISLWTIGN